MSHRREQDAEQPGDEMSPEVLIRCAADGELTPEQEPALWAYLRANPGAREAIEFERQLRERCREIMGGVYAPWSLREGVAKIASEASRKGAPSGRGSAGTPVVLWRRPVFRAIAALLMLAVILGVLSSQVVSGLMEAPSITKGWYRAQLVGHVVSEHRRCDIPDYVVEKMSVLRPEEIAQRYDPYLDHRVAVPSFASLGYAFRGSGRCNVPGRGPSIQMLFEHPAPSGSQGRLSVFAKQDRGEFTIPENRLYVLDHGDAGAPGIRPVLVWRSGGLVYLLVCGDAKLKASDLAECIGFPTPVPGDEL
jgi:anti-sigma factor RsiW